MRADPKAAREPRGPFLGLCRRDVQGEPAEVIFVKTLRAGCSTDEHQRCFLELQTTLRSKSRTFVQALGRNDEEL
jgi:hypothetical protein